MAPITMKTGLRRPEVLAPAGDEAALDAAIDAGADAVYLGLKAWSARARATNFDDDAFERALAKLHAHGRKGYVALNTLVFDAELSEMERAIRRCARAGVDAVIVQDLGVARMVRAIAPTMPLHASTQMTCTDAASVEFAASLGASRVILARELSLDDVREIRESTNVELEVFVHGALCIAYSGQCLTSEAIGGRSANRGACAQACRLPYELVVDGELRERADRAYLLSPQDLEASELVPRLAELGVASIKIEGRLKGPAYVAANTRLYRNAVDALGSERAAHELLRDEALATFTRGSGPGFLEGVDHQRLVEGRGCDHRGLLVGEAIGLERVRGRSLIRARLSAGVARGDGLLVEGGFAGEGEIGGRIWSILAEGQELESTTSEHEVLVWLGPDKRVDRVERGRRVFLSDAPRIERRALERSSEAPVRQRVDFVVRGAVGQSLEIEARTADGRVVVVRSDEPLEAARGAATDELVVRDKLGRLGGSAFALGEIRLELEGRAFVAPALLNRLRRDAVAALDARASRHHPTTDVTAESLLESAQLPQRNVPSAGLFVLCRTLEQARAARRAGADGVWLDFLELQGTGAAFRALRDEGAGFVGVAPPRIRKPGEQKIDRYLASLGPDGVLVRGLGALGEVAQADTKALFVGDFSLNATNRLTAAELLSRGLDAFTPSFDLDADQLVALLRTAVGPYAELVVHHPMPLFHMEHCVIAAELSTGRDHRDCGRPCEKHRVSLRDRTGLDHPVEADVGCRNTVFHAASQSAAAHVPDAIAAGVRRFRVELVRESAEQVEAIVAAYRALLASTLEPPEVWRRLRTEGRYGVVRGSLRVLQDAPALAR